MSDGQNIHLKWNHISVATSFTYSFIHEVEVIFPRLPACISWVGRTHSGFGGRHRALKMVGIGQAEE